MGALIAKERNSSNRSHQSNTVDDEFVGIISRYNGFIIGKSAFDECRSQYYVVESKSDILHVVFD
jgi:hypothetical protein